MFCRVKWIAFFSLIIAILLSLFLLCSCQTQRNSDEIINNALRSDGFTSLTQNEQCDKVQKAIDDSVKAGLIQKDVQYNSQDNIFTFRYSDGTRGGVDLSVHSEGSNENTLDSCTFPENNISVFNEGAAYADGTQKKMHILFAFEDQRKQNYLNIEQEWRKMGLDTSVDYDVTVDDLSKLKGYDCLLFSMHGGTYESRPVLRLLEEENAENRESYQDYLDRGLIASVSRIETGFKKVYWVLPEFFGEVYGNNELANTCILSESCRFLGVDGQGEEGIDRSFPNNFEHAGAACSFGFRNPVSSEYSLKMTVGMVDSMVNDYKTIGDSFENAKSLYGSNDSNYPYDNKKYIATPYLFGDILFSLRRDDFRQAIKSDFQKRLDELNSRYQSVRNLRSNGDSESKAAGRIDNVLSELNILMSEVIQHLKINCPSVSPNEIELTQKQWKSQMEAAAAKSVQEAGGGKMGSWFEVGSKCRSTIQRTQELINMIS